MFPKLLNTVLIILEVLLIFNLLIVVHELGHFLAARWRGLVVDEFGVWFGKPVWRKKLGGVWYSLGSIPAGGFVKLPQLAPMEAIEGETEERETPLPPISPLDKIIVAFAGPLFSFLLAFVMAGIVWAAGKPVHEFDRTTVIGVVKPGGPADKAGLRPGDQILEIDGKPVDCFTGPPLHSVTWRVMSSEGETIAFKILRDGKELVIESGWTREESPGWKRKSLRKVFIGQRLIPSVGTVEPGSAAEKAGIVPGDVVTAVNGTLVEDMSGFYDRLGNAVGQPVALTLKRGEASVEVSLTPEAPGKGDKMPKVGIGWGRLTLIHPTPMEQVTDAVLSIGNMLDALFSPKSDVRAQHFSGPVGILRAYYNLFDSDQGWRLALAFSVFFNVNLGLFNMLPFPVLDGGHITLALLESIRRRPINSRFLEVLQTGCAVAVMLFLAYVTFFDVSEFLPGRKAKTPAAAAETKPVESGEPAAAPSPGGAGEALPAAK
jgi:regulator of sigma E protease